MKKLLLFTLFFALRSAAAWAQTPDTLTMLKVLTEQIKRGNDSILLARAACDNGAAIGIEDRVAGLEYRKQRLLDKHPRILKCGTMIPFDNRRDLNTRLDKELQRAKQCKNYDAVIQLVLAENDFQTGYPHIGMGDVFQNTFFRLKEALIGKYGSIDSLIHTVSWGEIEVTRQAGYQKAMRKGVFLGFKISQTVYAKKDSLSQSELTQIADEQYKKTAFYIILTEAAQPVPKGITYLEKIGNTEYALSTNDYIHHACIKRSAVDSTLIRSAEIVKQGEMMQILSKYWHTGKIVHKKDWYKPFQNEVRLYTENSEWIRFTAPEVLAFFRNYLIELIEKNKK